MKNFMRSVYDYYFRLIPRQRGDLLEFLSNARSHLDTKVTVRFTEQPITPYYAAPGYVMLPDWFLADNITDYSLNTVVAKNNTLGKNTLSTTLLSAGLIYADVRRLKSTQTHYAKQLAATQMLLDNANPELLNKLVHLVEDINLEYLRRGEFGSKFVEFFNEWMFGGLMTGMKWSRVEQATTKEELLAYLLSFFDSFRAPSARNHPAWSHIPELQAILANTVGADNITRQREIANLYDAIKDLLEDPPPTCQCANENEESNQDKQTNDDNNPTENYRNNEPDFSMGDLDISPAEQENFTELEIQNFEYDINHPEEKEITFQAVESYSGENNTINYIDIEPHGSVECDKTFKNVAQIIQMLRAKKHDYKGLTNNGGIVSDDDLWRISLDGFIFEPPSRKLRRTHRTIVVLVDLSSSISGTIGNERLAKAVYGLSDSLRKNGERVYVLGFSNEHHGIKIYRILRPGQANLAGRFSAMAHAGGGSTPEAHGLLAAIRALEKENGEKMIIVMNDGMPNVSFREDGNAQKSVQRMIKLAHKNKIKTLYVSLTKEIVERNDALCGADNNVHGYDGKLETSLQELIMQWEQKDKG